MYNLLGPERVVTKVSQPGGQSLGGGRVGDIGKDRESPSPVPDSSSRGVRGQDGSSGPGETN